jgi:hypothetical protein
MRMLAATLFSLTVPLFAHAQTGAGMLVYRFDQVNRTVTVSTAGAEARPVAIGTSANSGDRVHTGWFSSALLADEQHRATFELFARTDVVLASNAPGVILTLERGKLEAIFDKITGTEPRIVQTPGALLAVRGTAYLVEVDAKGETTLDVYEGTVEVNSPLEPQPFLVHAGESSDFGPRRPPVVLPTPRERMRPDARKDADRRNGGDRAQGGDRGAGGGNDRGGQPGHGGPNDPGRHGGNPQPGGPGPGPQQPPPGKPPGRD